MKDVLSVHWSSLRGLDSQHRTCFRLGREGETTYENTG